MKKLFVVLILVFGFLASFAGAEAVKDYSLEEIIQVKNAPTKNIVEQEIGHEIMMYQWHPGNEFLEIKGYYGSIRGKIIDKGIEQDTDGRDYNYVIVYFKNYNYSENRYIKFMQYSWKKDSVLAVSGIATPPPKIQFIVRDNSWTEVENFNEFGGYGEEIYYAAL